MKMNKSENVLKLAKALNKHSKKLEHKNESGEKINLKVFREFMT